MSTTTINREIYEQVREDKAPPANTIQKSKREWVSWLYYQATRLAIGFITHAPLIMIGIAVYIWITQGPLKTPWDNLWPDTFWRHLGRGTVEIVFAGAGAQAVTFNSFAFEKRLEKKIAKRKAKGKDVYNWVDKAEIRLHIPNAKKVLHTPLTKWQRRAFPIVGLLYMAPGFILAGFAILLGQEVFAHAHNGLAIGHHVYHVQLHGHAQSVWQKLVEIYTKEGGPKIAGLFASVVMLRRPMTAVFYDNHRLYAQRRNTYHGGRLHWYHRLVPAYSQRVKTIKTLHAYPVVDVTRWWRFRHAIKVAAIVLIVLGTVAYGYHAQVDIIAPALAHS